MVTFLSISRFGVLFLFAQDAVARGARVESIVNKLSLNEVLPVDEVRNYDLVARV